MQVHMICFELQFRFWYQLLIGEIEGVVLITKEEDELISDDWPTLLTTTFDI